MKMAMSSAKVTVSEATSKDGQQTIKEEKVSLKDLLENFVSQEPDSDTDNDAKETNERKKKKKSGLYLKKSGL